MPRQEAMPDINTLQLSDSDEDLFASPSRKSAGAENPQRASSTRQSHPIDSENPPDPTSHHSTAEAREASLRKELSSVQNINTAIEGVIDSLERAKANMDTVSRTVQTSTTLLQTWTRILAQAEHNQRLILNPAWQGASQDVADAESEALGRQQAAERREMEELQRREAASRRAEEEERRRVEGVVVGRGRGKGRGRGRGNGRGAAAGVGQGGGRGVSSVAGRAGSGIGRGMLGSRGKGRGIG